MKFEEWFENFDFEDDYEYTHGDIENTWLNAWLNARQQTISRVIQILHDYEFDGDPELIWAEAIEEIKKEFDCTEKSYGCSEVKE